MSLKIFRCNSDIDYDYDYNHPYSDAPYNCEKFDPLTGTWDHHWAFWEPFSFPGRVRHVAWMSSIGLFLIGGAGQSG